MKKIVSLLEHKEVRPTPVRMLVLEVFFKYNYAISLADIEAELPWSDRSSIFRTLKTFEKNSLIHEVNDGSKAVKYAMCSNYCNVIEHLVHPHFHCEKCDKTICLDKQKIVINNLPNSLKINNYSLILNGICEECQ